MMKDTQGVPIGQCLVRFVSMNVVDRVVQNLNGVELGGRPMEVMSCSVLRVEEPRRSFVDEHNIVLER